MTSSPFRLSSFIKDLHEKIYDPVRYSILAQVLSPFVQGCSTGLDYGCGDGHLAKIIETITGCKFSGVDVIIRKNTEIPVQSIADNPAVLPFQDNSFDVVMLIDVLHHTPDYSVGLKEAIRVTRKYVIVKDHYYDTPEERANLCFADFMGNAIYGVALPYNFMTTQQWNEVLASLPDAKEISRAKFEIGVFDICNHVMIVLEKV